MNVLSGSVWARSEDLHFSEAFCLLDLGLVECATQPLGPGGVWRVPRGASRPLTGRELSNAIRRAGGSWSTYRVRKEIQAGYIEGSVVESISIISREECENVVQSRYWRWRD